MTAFTRTTIKTQVWYPSTKTRQHRETQALGTGQTTLLLCSGADSVIRQSYRHCHEPPGQRREPQCCAVRRHAWFCPQSSQLPAPLPHGCLGLVRGGSRAGRSPAPTNPPAPSKTRRSTEGSGKGGGGGESPVLWWKGFPAPRPETNRGLAAAGGRSASLQPAEGGPDGAGSSRSGRHCWWPGHCGKR